MRPAVLHVIDSFHQGGSERQALQLTRLLKDANNFEVRLACLSSEGSLRSSIADLDLGEIPTFPLTSFYDQNAVRQLRRFVTWSKASHIQLVHTHDFYTNVFATTAGALAHVPVRIASMRETAGMRSGMQRQVQRVAYKLAHHIVANSQAVKQRLMSDGIKGEKITVVYNGLDLSRLQTQLSRARALALLGVQENASSPYRFISIVANMRHEVKDYPMFLRAARKVKQDVPEAAFLLAGEGELETSLKQMAGELGIADCTFFLGRCELIAELLSVSSVCVLSSKAEGFSNSILEYMAAGKPVVATNVGGAAEAIVEGETGYLVPSGDDTALADSLVSLCRAPDRAAEMGEAGRRLVSKNFSCEAQLLRTEELYDTLLRARSRG